MMIITTISYSARQIMLCPDHVGTILTLGPISIKKLLTFDRNALSSKRPSQQGSIAYIHTLKSHQCYICYVISRANIFCVFGANLYGLFFVSVSLFPR